MVSLHGEVGDVKNEVQRRLGDVLNYFHANEGTVNLDVFITLAFTQSKEKFLLLKINISYILILSFRSSLEFISQFIQRGNQGTIRGKLFHFTKRKIIDKR